MKRVKNANDMQGLAKLVGEALNGKGVSPKDHTNGFVLLTFGFNAPGIANYISNGNRADVIQSLRETADRLEKKQTSERVPFND